MPSAYTSLRHRPLVTCVQTYPACATVLLAEAASYHMKRLPANIQHSSESRQHTSCTSSECGGLVNEAS